MTLPVPLVAVGRPSIVARFVTKAPEDYGAVFRNTTFAEVVQTRQPAVLLLNGQQLDEVERQLDMLLTRPMMRGGLKRNLALAIDASGEGFAIVPALFAKWHAVLDAHGVSPRRVAYLTHNEAAAASYRAWLRQSGRAEGLRVLLHHPFMHRTSLFLRDAWKEPTARAHRLEVVRMAPDRVDRDARFLCLNNKPHAHRMVIAGRILGGSLSSQTLLSFAFASKPLHDRDTAPLVAEARRSLPRFGAELDTIEARLADMPLAIPGDDPGNGIGDIVFRMPPALYERSLLSLVPETNFVRNGTERFTEKSVKAFAAGHPTILAALPGTLRLLRGVGFATFDPFIDEDYDSISDPEDRLAAVFEEVERIGRLTPPQLRALLQRCLPAMEHNVRHAAEGLPALMRRQLEGLAHALLWMAETGGRDLELPPSNTTFGVGC
jgi:hypothetical protein